MLELRTAYSRSFCGSRDEIIFIETNLLEKHRKKSHPAAGIDGMKGGDFPDFAKAQWSLIRYPNGPKRPRG